MSPSTEDWTADFDGVVRSIDEIRTVLGEPFQPSVTKVLDHVDDIAAAFIKASPFMLMASTGADGHVTISPKGDPAGFVRVLDSHRIAIPDRPGNRRLDSFHNILENPNVGLLFMVPTRPDTLRISGEARIVCDAGLRESMAVDGKAPEFATVIRVARVYVHCPKCQIRARLWDPEAWADVGGLTSFGEAMAVHSKAGLDADALEQKAKAEGMLKLY